MKFSPHRTIKLATVLSVLAFLVVGAKPLWQWQKNQSWQRAQKPSPNQPSSQETTHIHQSVLRELTSTFAPMPPPLPEAAGNSQQASLSDEEVIVFVDPQTIQMDAKAFIDHCAWDVSREPQKQDLHLMESPPHSLFVELCLMNQKRHPIDLSLLNQLPNASIYPKKHAMPFASWQAFGKDHPNSIGFVGLSQPVISDDGLSALVYVAHDCGELCGQTAFYWLLKHRADWRIKKVILHAAS